MVKNTVGRVAALLMVLLMLGSACNGCGKQPEFCKGLELAANEGQPLDEVEVLLDLEVDEGEDPIEVGNLFAEVTVKGIDDPFYTLIKQDEELDTYTLVVPPHPEGVEGGKVKLRILNDTGECNKKQKFEILPIDKAPGTLQAVVDKIHRIAELEAEAFGHTLQDLETGTAETLPTPLWGPARGVWGASDPENPNSLEKIAENESAVDLSEGLELAEALLAKSGQLESLDNVIEALEELQEPPAEIIFEPRAIVSPSALPYRTRQSALICDDLVLSPVIGRDVKLLSYYMSLAASATQELQDGTADQVDLVATILSTVPHPAAKAAGIAMGLAAFYRKSTTQVYANTLPSALVDPELEVTREWFEEDTEETGNWKDGYSVSAASNGMDLTGTLLTGLINAVDSLFGAAGLIPKEIKDALQTSDIIKDIVQTGATEFLKAHVGDIEGGCTVAPEEWGPFNMSDTLWSEVDYTLGIQGVQGDRWAYKPREVETGYIEVKVPDGAFPPSSNVAASKVVKPVEVRAIVVTLQPGYGRIEPGGELTPVRAVVRNAVDTRVKWTLISPLNKGASVTELGATEADPDVSTATVVGAASADDYPVVIKARALSRSGLREEKYPERADFGHYNADERIQVSPPFKCVKSGGTQDYEARIIGSDDTTIEWTTTGGRIDGDTPMETYHATDDGLHTITASHADLELSDSVDVVVGQCKCEYDVTMVGAVLARFGHYTDMTASVNGRSLLIAMRHPDGHLAQIISNQESGLGVDPGVPGRYKAVGDVALSGSVGVVDSFITGLSEETFADLWIESWEDNYITGYFVGRAIYFPTIGAPEDEKVWVDITMTFSMYVQDTADILDPTSIFDDDNSFLQTCDLSEE